MHRHRRSERCRKDHFARRYLPEGADVVHFVNADLITAGLSPLDPGLAAVRAARLVLQEIDRLAVDRTDFAFETTLSGLGYARRIRAWKRAVIGAASAGPGYAPGRPRCAFLHLPWRSCA